MKYLYSLMLLLPLLFALPTARAAPTDASGSFTASDPVVTGTRTAGGNTIMTRNVMFDLSGTFTGSCVGTDTFILRADGGFTFQGKCTFTGTIGGRSGTAVIIDRGAASRSGFQGHFAFLGASGGLEGLHLWGTFQVTSPSTGTYSGHYFFDR